MIWPRPRGGLTGAPQAGRSQPAAGKFRPRLPVSGQALAEIRRAYLQTRVDALADELLPKGPEDGR